MAKHSASILEYAKLGADQRYSELKAELASLVKAFPHLGSAVSPAMPIDVSSELGKVGRRRRRGKLSAAGRRAIAAAQRARWAKVKVKQSGVANDSSGKKRREMSAEARAKIGTAQKARWAKVKAGKKK